MQISEIMTRDVVTTHPDRPMSAAIELFATYRIGFLVVVDEGQIVGVLTEGDIVNLTANNLAIDMQIVRSHMSAPVFSVAEDSNVFHAYDELVLKGMLHLVVTDNQGALSGVVTMSNFLASMGVEQFSALQTVQDSMSPLSQTVNAGALLGDVARCMAESKHAMLVLDEQRPVGILTSRDITHLQGQQVDFSTLTMCQCMSSPVYTIAASAFMPDASALMKEHRLRHLAVVDDHGHCIGLLTIADVARSIEGKYVDFLRSLLIDLEVDLKSKSSQQMALFDYNPNAVMSFRADGAIGAANPAAILLTGHSANILREMYLSELILEADFSSCWETFEQAIAGKACNVLVRMQCQSGRIASVYLVLVPIIHQGEQSGLYIVFHDITERQQSESHARKLSQALEQASEAVVICDMAGRIEFANVTMQTLLGDQENNLIGQYMHHFLPTEDMFERGIQSTISDGNKWKCELNIQHPDGSQLPVLLSCAPIRSEQQDVTHLVAIFEDLSSLRALEQERREAAVARDMAQRVEKDARMAQLALKAEQAHAASKAKSKFLADMNHELRTPVHGIIGLLNMLEKEADYLTPAHREQLDLALHSSHLLKSLIEDILDLSKIEAGKLDIHYSEYHLPTALHAAIAPFIMGAKEKNIILDLICTDIPETIVADEKSIRQILMNLLGNALKFTDHGSIQIRVSFVDGELTLAIEDSGIGISEHQLITLFQPFVQLSQDASRQGTGLGTTISKRLANAMHGDIHASSVFGQGSIFTITLPVECVGDQRLSQHINLYSAPEKPAPVCMLNLQGLRVLLAEDDMVSRMIALDKLNQAGLNVDVAEHGIEAWEKIQANDYDLLLTDIRMPGLNGIELTQHIRAHEKSGGHRTRIIGLSAHAMEEVAQECLAEGMDDFISKPIDPDILLNRLNLEPT